MLPAAIPLGLSGVLLLTCSSALVSARAFGYWRFIALQRPTRKVITPSVPACRELGSEQLQPPGQPARPSQLTSAIFEAHAVSGPTLACSPRYNTREMRNRLRSINAELVEADCRRSALRIEVADLTERYGQLTAYAPAGLWSPGANACHRFGGCRKPLGSVHSVNRGRRRRRIVRAPAAISSRRRPAVPLAAQQQPSMRNPLALHRCRNLPTVPGTTPNTCRL